MSSPLMRSAIIVLLLTWVSFGCEQEVTSPSGEIALESLYFLKPEIEAGEPLIIVGRIDAPGRDARIEAGESLPPQPFSIRTGEEGPQRDFFRPLLPERRMWFALPDAELTMLISYWDNNVFIGFKEAGAEAGVDNQGRTLTSEQTVEMMIDWLTERGVSIIREFETVPAVSGRMPAEVDLVATLRAHENIDYLEPGGSEPCRDDDPCRTVGAGDLVALIPTGNEASGPFGVRSGETITAEYHQPDGSVLRTQAQIR